ncbi:MAG: exosortase/archaeosortase family protein [Pirellulales bacterium]
MNTSKQSIASSPFSSQSFSSHEADFHDTPLAPAAQRTAWITLGLFALALVVAYWNMLTRTAGYWNDDLYSHGWIVPAFAAYLLWMRRKPLSQIAASERWIGLGILACSLALRAAASYYDMAPLDRLSFIGALVGLCQMVGGAHMLRWAGWPVVFLVFMFPLPAILETGLLSNLQKLAAIGSNLTLQTMGLPATRDASRIIIDIDTQTAGEVITLGVVDACSGLRMLTIFCSLAVAMALLIDRPWWDRLIILLSAIPIALISNMIRIVVTALLFYQFGQDQEWLNHIIHDWAGFAMMPIGLGFLWVEIHLLSRITTPIETDDYSSLGIATH